MPIKKKQTKPRKRKRLPKGMHQIEKLTTAYNKSWADRDATHPKGRPTEAHYCALAMAICGYSPRSSIGYWLLGWDIAVVRKMNDMNRVNTIRDCIMCGTDIPDCYCYIEGVRINVD